MKKLLRLALALGAAGAGTAGCTIDDTYVACADGASCNDPADACQTVAIAADRSSEATSGGFCSHPCASDAECEFNFGFDGVCYAIEDDPTFLCFQQCNEDGDCWSGNVCRRLDFADGTFDTICVPSN